MKTEDRRTCPSCGNEFSGAMEFCPVCMLRIGLAGGVESGKSFFEEAVKPTPEQARQRFEHYELVMGADGTPVELGRGVMGVTYKAFDADLHCPVTLKVIREKYLGDESARLRFLREARAAASVRHPNVASVFHLGRTGQKYFYAMEFVEGETLENLIKRFGRLEVKLALEIATQVAAGLAAVHKQKLLHRDIKPSNIMVMLGLFDCPADEKVLAVLVRSPAIPGLTESLTDLSPTEWRTIPAKLRRARLLAGEDPHNPGHFDTHPLVREYFGQGVTRVSVMESCASVSASGLPRCCRTTSAVPRACMSPMAIPRPSDGFVQAHESPTLDDPCRHRNAVHDETPVTVDGAAHGKHVGDRLTVEPVCVQRTCGDESHPVLEIAELLQRLVARGDEQGHRPGARVAGERED